MSKVLVIADYEGRQPLAFKAGAVLDDSQFPVADMIASGMAAIPHLVAMDAAIARFAAYRQSHTAVHGEYLVALLVAAQLLPYTPASLPVTSITPLAGTPLGGDAVRVQGSGFAPGCTVTIGGVACTSVVVVSSGEITCVTPAGSAGAQDVVVTRGDVHGSLVGGFVYAVAPSFASIAPATGSHVGGTSVTLSGSGFIAGTTVTVGGLPLAGAVILSQTTITGAVAAHAAGAVDVVVANANGTATAVGAFSYT